jgi:hypothetical protein
MQDPHSPASISPVLSSSSKDPGTAREEQLALNDVLELPVASSQQRDGCRAACVTFLELAPLEEYQSIDMASDHRFRGRCLARKTSHIRQNHPGQTMSLTSRQEEIPI